MRIWNVVSDNKIDMYTDVCFYWLLCLLVYNTTDF